MRHIGEITREIVERAQVRQDNGACSNVVWVDFTKHVRFNQKRSGSSKGKSASIDSLPCSKFRGSASFE